MGVSPRELMERTFQRCKRYARTFHPGAPSLLFTGGPGLGKTYLSACIARAVADNGFSVVYDTAGKLFADFEAVKFGGDQRDLTRKYLDCDLLIIDDLGTESIKRLTVRDLPLTVDSEGTPTGDTFTYSSQPKLRNNW